jgi:hypothetical protein
MVQPDFRHQALKTVTAFGTRARPPEVLIDHQDPRLGPPQGYGPLYESILQPRRLLMIQYLLHGRLPHVHHCKVVAVSCIDFFCLPSPLVSHVVAMHTCPPFSGPPRSADV